jgi:hypothetical protein
VGSISFAAFAMGSSRSRTAVCTDGATARRTAERARAGLIEAICWVTSNGVLCCATRGGKLSCAAVFRARRVLIPRCVSAACALAALLLVLVLDASLRKICTTIVRTACCRGQYKLATHNSTRCTSSTASHTPGRLRATGRSRVRNRG